MFLHFQKIPDLQDVIAAALILLHILEHVVLKKFGLFFFLLFCFFFLYYISREDLDFREISILTI